MNPHLEEKFNTHEKNRKILLQLAAAQPEDVLKKMPPPGKWSILQILTHLYISEKLSIGYIKKKSLGIDSLKNAGLQHSLMVFLLKISQRIPVRYKAPKTVLQNTPEPLPLPELIAQWNLLQLELKSMLENLPDKHVHKLVYKHPAVGRLSLPQAVDFFAEHIIHHLPQVKRIIDNQQ